MNKKGFTLVEVIVTIVIIALISGIGIIAYQSFFGTGEEKYYNALENDILLAGNDYFVDHRDDLPTGNRVSEVELSTLVNAKYLESVKDSKGNTCTNGKVYVYRENNQYMYEVCLDCNGYKSTGKYCDGSIANQINITAKTKSTNQPYNAVVSYNAAEYTNNENVIVTFSMNNTKATKYETTNTKTNSKKSCVIGSGTSCSVEIDESGTYKVVAYDNSNNVLSNDQYFSVKIAKNGPKFTISGIDKYQISKDECSNSKTKKRVTYTIVKDNINEEYKTIQYKINNGSYKSINTLVINEDLESGHYTLEVRITNFANDATIITKDFNISYLIDLEYSDAPTEKHTHEVVKGQKYDYLSLLPTKRTVSGKSLEVKWHPDNTTYSDAIRIKGTSIVDNNCTYKIKGMVPIMVDVPSNWTTYCSNPTYNGKEQTITNTAPTNVTFSNNKKTNQGKYTVTAHINSPFYIWKSDLTYGDKTFECSLAKKNVAITWDNKTSFVYNGSEQAPTASAESGVTGETIKITRTTKINVGSYTSTASCSSVVGGQKKCDNYNLTSKTKDYKITRLGIDFPTCADKTYNTKKQVLFEAHTSGAYTNSEISGTAAKTYKGTLTPSSNHKWNSGSDVTSGRELSCTINKLKCSTPTGVTISTAGKVTWTASSNCSSAQHQVKIASGSYANATSGVDKKSDIIASTGSRKAYVKAVAPNSNYSDSNAGEGSTTVYSVSLTKGTGISAVSGDGNYITGSAATLGATVSSGYNWNKWTQTSGGADVSSTQAYSGTISGNWAYTANATIIKYEIKYKYHEHDNYADGEYLNTGYKVNWNRDFKIEVTFSYATKDKRHLIIGNYDGNNNINIEVTDNNKLRLYINNGAVDKTSSSSIPKNTSTDVVFTWDATNKAYNLTATPSGKSTITISGTVQMSGTSNKSLRINRDHRSGSLKFTQIHVTALSITDTRESGSTLSDLPQFSKSGRTYKGWYTESSGGSAISTSTTVTGNATYHLRWKKWTKNTYACTSGTWSKSVDKYVSECSGISRSYANSHNTNTYRTCDGIYSSSCPSGNTVMCQHKVEYSRSGCATYSSTATQATGQYSCEASSDKNYKYTCTEES